MTRSVTNGGEGAQAPSFLRPIHSILAKFEASSPFIPRDILHFARVDGPSGLSRRLSPAVSPHSRRLEFLLRSRPPRL